MTTPLGKDAPLETTLERFTAILDELGLSAEAVAWFNPLPHVHSVQLQLARCPLITANGKGTSREAALASGLGELIERLATHQSFSDYFLGLANSGAEFVHFPDERWLPVTNDDDPLPENLLTPTLREFYQNGAPLHLGDLVDLQSSSYARGVCCLPFTNARSAAEVLFPVNLLDNLYGTNGMSAGNTGYEALVQALSEILERHVRREVVSRGLALPEVPAEVLKRHATADAILAALDGGGLHAVCYDASLGGRFPVLCVVLFNQRSGGCTASFGAHPIFEVALERCLTELLQGRSLSDLDELEEPVFALERTADPVNLETQIVDGGGLLPLQMFRRTPDYRYVDWDFNGATRDQYKALRYIIDKLGFDVYVRAYPRLGVPVVRVVVPGLSELYPAGDLLYRNNNRAVDFQEALLGLPQSREEPATYAAYLDELEAAVATLEDEAPLAALLGVQPDAGSPWETLRLGELKCLLALAGRRWQNACQLARWTVEFNRHNFPLERLRFYQCLTRLLECRLDGALSEDDYLPAFGNVYSAATLDAVSAHLDGSQRFFGLQASDLNLRGFLQHQEILKTYALVKEADLHERIVKNDA